MNRSCSSSVMARCSASSRTLTGRPYADVATELAKLDLVVELVEQNDEVVPIGNVISWAVPDDPTLVAGSQVLPGRLVRVVSSIGPAPRTVPDLVGLTFADAQATVEPLALGVSEAERQFSDTVPIDTVISQTPLPGEQVERGTGIVVVVSKGPDVVIMPDLAGMTFDVASSTLTAAGFVPVLSFGAVEGTLQSASINGVPAEVGSGVPARHAGRLGLSLITTVRSFGSATAPARSKGRLT